MIRRDRGLRLLVALVMVCFVIGVYALVVVGGGKLLGRTGAPSLWLSVLATAIVAIAFEPIRLRVKRWLSRALHQDRISPYQVLAHFPKTVTGAFRAEELPGRMAKVLAEGTGSARAEVWLVVHGQLELAARWPDPAPSSSDRPQMEIAQCAATAGAAPAPNVGMPTSGDAPAIVVQGLRHSIAVRERGELLGALTVIVRDGQHLTPVEERLFAGLAAQSGLMLRVAGLRTELEQQLLDLQRRTEELRRARRDLVSRQDAERQRLERNIHDGAQQEVIALLVNLRLAQTLLARSPERGAALLGEQAAAARATIETLTALSRGLYPKLLTDRGPVAALTAAVASGPIPVELSSTDLPRCPPDVEAAVYFTCLEAVQNATKHSKASQITIDIRMRTDGSFDRIELIVADDGQGFDITRRTGNGLFNITDRIESVLGHASIESSPGAGTTVRATIPVNGGTATINAGSSDSHQADEGLPDPAAPRMPDVLPVAGS
jgi:signal transduction histidine kinase